MTKICEKQQFVKYKIWGINFLNIDIYSYIRMHMLVGLSVYPLYLPSYIYGKTPNINWSVCLSIMYMPNYIQGIASDIPNFIYKLNIDIFVKLC